MIKLFEDYNSIKNVKHMMNHYVNLSELIENTHVPKDYGDVVKLEHHIFDDLSRKNRLRHIYEPGHFFGIPLAGTEYRYAVDEALFELYPEYVKQVGKLKGLVVDNKWVIFNKINTNNVIVSYTINYLNAFILDEIIDLETYNFNSILASLVLKYKEQLYGSDIFMRGALLILLCLNRKDILATKYIMEFLSKHSYKDFEEGGLGKFEDMIGGVDLKYTTKKGEVKTAQIKNFRSIELINDLYRIKGTAAPKIYPAQIDYYFFYRFTPDEKLDELYIFKNDNVMVGDKDYLFPKENKLYPK